ncbi:MAG: DNA-methyltransferase [Armatimonadota bacterium]|jgi:DNA modification methylase
MKISFDSPTVYYETSLGQVVLGDSLEYLRDNVSDEGVDLIVTSPPFGLVRKKDYGNVDASDYVHWFRAFGREFHRVLRSSGSLVIDIGGSWVPRQPTRSLYHFKLLIMLCEEIGFHLAQEFFWWNPSKLPTPAEWVTVRRVRVKDAVNCIWWLSKTPWPKASNRRVLQPYSASMRALLRDGYQAKRRPSGHDISAKFTRNNAAAIPPNLIAVANTESNGPYLRYCKEQGLTPHPARFPAEIPEYFVRMLTDRGDYVIDPFAGSCTTGEVCERLGRQWIAVEMEEEYLKGAIGRFESDNGTKPSTSDSTPSSDASYYRVPRPGTLWNGDEGDDLPSDGGRQRPKVESDDNSP